jgi:pimeloyl-ACP methyl ester carboxylesterase
VAQRSFEHLLRTKNIMNFRQISSHTMVALVAWVATLSGCTQSEMRATEQSAPSALRAPNRGLYGFDGTTNVEADNTAVFAFLKDSKLTKKRYFRGANLSASDYAAIVSEGVAEICREDAKEPFDELYLVGYSRGAVAALEVAARVASECARPVPVRWLGLVDAVATSVSESLEIGNAGRSVLSTRCIHVVKSHEKRPLLATASVLSCPDKVVEADHSVVARSPQTLELLRADVRTVAPDFFGGAVASGCSGAAEPLACLARGCSWSNATCVPLKP